MQDCIHLRCLNYVHGVGWRFGSSLGGAGHVGLLLSKENAIHWTVGYVFVRPGSEKNRHGLLTLKVSGHGTWGAL